MLWDKNLEIFSISLSLIHVKKPKLKICHWAIFEIIKKNICLPMTRVTIYPFSGWTSMPSTEMEALSTAQDWVVIWVHFTSIGAFPLTSVSCRDWAFYDCRISCCQDQTVGDEYLVVGGVTVPITSHALGVANLAFDMGFSPKRSWTPWLRSPFR